jgi:hypothetical protein
MHNDNIDKKIRGPSGEVANLISLICKDEKQWCLA